MTTPADTTRPPATRVDPLLIRAVLADLEHSTAPQVAKAHGFEHKSVYRWQRVAAAHPGWPTDADVETWHTAERTLRRKRDRQAAQTRDYRRRTYLARGRMSVPSIGTTRRLRALYAIGWTSNDLAPLLGYGVARVSHLVTGHRQLIHRHTAAKVAAVYDHLSMTVPEEHDPATRSPRACRTRDRQRRQSAAKGWAPPLAWDDDTIDDPDGQPVGWLGGDETAAARRAATITELHDEGADLWDVLRAVDMSRNSFQTWCRRNGLGHLYIGLAARARGEAAA